MKIFLIGMPGSGKTTLGEQLAVALAIPFVDLDKEIESQEGKSVAEIFQQKGEPYFRQVESSLLNQWAARQESYVMSTGGGAPCHFNGMQTINANGLSVFLEVPIDVLVQRTKSKSHRPLLNSGSDDALKNKLSALLSEREKIYRTAHFTLSSPTLTNVLSALKIKR